MAEISFVTTVKNDPAGLAVLLRSLKKLSRKPDEVIVIDAEKTRTNRAQGRNLGIKKAKGEIIAISDAGCTLSKNWLRTIIDPFKDSEVDVVAGYYQPVTKNVFQKCLATYTSVMPGQLKEKEFLPSSRSIAFRKKAWQKVGGYPENLDYCEDLVFAQRLKKAGCQIKLARKALVFWPQRKNLFEAFWQFFHYASGDAQTQYWPHLKKIFLVYCRYLFAFWLFGQVLAYWLLGLLVYSGWAVIKNYRYVKHFLALIYLPLLQITADLAVMSGALRGWLKKV